MESLRGQEDELEANERCQRGRQHMAHMHKQDVDIHVTERHP